MAKQLGIVVCVFVLSAGALHAQTVEAPPGYTAIFNGTDLAGWHGMPHVNPDELAAMPEADRQAKIDEWTNDAKAHWRVESERG